MNIYTNTRSSFPSQVVSDTEKASLEYGRKLVKLSNTNGLDKGVLMVIDT